ncbi:hypothetical protein [Escherichia coli]|uniref:hypothetical protein n=1 Tax=Escherichia coli TaxID=562 RepID=UPI001CBA9129|nr:hypothetical protein [Escherichia coli]
MTDNAFEVETRPGSFLVPRSLGKAISGIIFMAVVDGDTNVIREYDSDDADFGIYNAGEKLLYCVAGKTFIIRQKFSSYALSV